jgi:hypothetical protein
MKWWERVCPDRACALAAAVLVGVLVIALAILEAIGGEARGATEIPWVTYVQAMDAALAAGDARTARWALDRADALAFGSRRWDAMLDAGDAARRLGDLPQARRAYLTAVMRARTQRALDGVLRGAEAFAALGDREVAARCLRIAESLAGPDTGAGERVRAAALHLDDRARPRR